MRTCLTLQLLLAAIVCWHSSQAAEDWAYSGTEGPAYWSLGYPSCKKSHQSPINIYEGDVTPDTVTEAFAYTNYGEDVTMKLVNNGHSAKVSLSGTNLPEVSGGGLGGEFQAAQFHFHWSTDATKGSEHHISSTGFPSEVHIVHFRKSYGSLGDAADKADGLAVLGFMLEIQENDNPGYTDLIEGLAQVTESGFEFSLPNASMSSFLPPSFKDFYRYAGSLTTPPCYESVTWTVFKEPIGVSQAQMNAFLGLKKDTQNLIKNNARPVQPINSRVVTASFNPDIHWSYDHGHVNVANWPKYYEACGKKSQSPVNLPSLASTKDTSLGDFTFQRFDTTTGISMQLTNNGHTVHVGMSGASVPSISGGGLGEEYIVAQFHFHWGSHAGKGSEHEVDGVQYPMEVHIVTYKSSLGSLGAAAAQPEGLAVLGFFYEMSDDDNVDLEPILSQFSSISKPKDSVAISTVTIDSLIPADRSNYFRYSGSLTTPACYESVIWTVFDSKIPISESQLQKFRALLSSDKAAPDVYFHLINNYRPVQALHKRVVKRNFDPKVEAKAWSYEGGDNDQSNWYKNYPKCSSSSPRQSPINVGYEDVEFMDMDAFIFKDFDKTDGVKLEVSNNGHAAVVSYKEGQLEVKGGNLPSDDNFRVAQFHFHWGSHDGIGSEHLLANKAFPLELHIVTYNTEYADISLAMTQSNGLAVLGYMFEIAEEDNEHLKKLLDTFSEIEAPKSKYELDAKQTFSLSSMLPTDKSQYFRYDGSLTTPACYESVTWTIFKETIPISSKQLETFRQLKSSETDEQGRYKPLQDNFRDPQDLGERKVYANFRISASTTTTATVSTVVGCVFYAVCNILS